MNKSLNRAYLPSFSPEMQIFELVEAAPSVLSIFSRLDIRLPFGDISVEQMCKREGYTTELFLALCSIHASENFQPCTERLTVEMLPEVIDYLRASHRYYAEKMLPHTSAHLQEILECCDSLSRSMLRRFYDDYMAYIVDHFRAEEEHLFSIIDNATVRRADLTLLDLPHDDIDDRSNDIASLIFKSLPEEAPTKLRIVTLEHIYALRDDLRRHNNVERYILKPLVDKYLTTSI
ncbi:MAG: hemerythrin domain-containing protein [Alistipes sp.]|nr:hemerythrin domain-containing protein [Alistipes sp.]